MKIAVLGTGAVGQTMAEKLSRLGHEVFMGTRNVENAREKLEPDAMGVPGVGVWIRNHSEIQLLTFREAVEKAESLIVFAMNGIAALGVLQEVGAENLNGKTLLDISNPLDFSKGFPPTLSMCNTESLGEKIQENFPQLKVVKGLNTVSFHLMANPGLLEGDHLLFICGNDQDAKSEVRELLVNFGWESRNIVDMGDISAARGTEMLMPLYLRLLGKFQTPLFNFSISRAKPSAAAGI